MRACVDDVDGDDKSLLFACDNDGDDNSLQYRCAHIKSTYAETLVLLMSGSTIHSKSLECQHQCTSCLG